MCSFAAGEKVDIFPCEARVETHVVYVGAYSAVPACFGQVDKVTVAFVDLFEFELEVSKVFVGEVAFVV